VNEKRENLRNLGLLVVDEEQSSAYRSGQLKSIKENVDVLTLRNRRSQALQLSLMVS